jgi:hypothetical protein
MRAATLTPSARSAILHRLKWLPRSRLAFLITFSVMLGAAMLWTALFVGLSEVDSALLNAIAQWLSPERVSGWLFYFMLSALCFVPFARRFLRKR